MSRVDTAIRAAAGVTVAALAGIAGAISYSHMEGLAAAHGEHGWRGHAFPLSVDGIEVVASLVLLADRRAGRRSGWLPWAALVAGTGASFAANIAVGGSDWIGRAVSGWPAFALLTAVKLLFGLLDHPATTDPARLVAAAAPDGPGAAGTVPGTADGARELDRDGTGDGDGPAAAADGRDGGSGATGGPDPVPAAGECSRQPLLAPPEQLDSAPPDRGEPGAPAAPEQDFPPSLRLGAGAGSGCQCRQPWGPNKLPRSAGERLDVSALMPAGRAAWAELVRQGQPVTREALARQLRADGHAASNARVSALLRALAPQPDASEDAAA